jgi:hypothetical protein
VAAINPIIGASAFAGVRGIFVKLVMFSPKAKRENPRSDLRQNDQLHRVVAKPKDFFPSLILHLICP